MCHHHGITVGFKGEDLKQKESTMGMVWIVAGTAIIVSMSFKKKLLILLPADWSHYGKVSLNFFFQLLLVQKFHKNHNLYESFQSQTLRYLTNDILLGRESKITIACY